MAVWADLYPFMMGRLQGCPIPLAELELRKSAIRFFRESRVWKVVLDTIAPAGVPEFDLEVDESSQQPVRIEKAWGNGIRLSVYTADGMDSQFPDNWMLHTSSAPQSLVQIVPNVARIYPIPTASVSVTIRMSVCPSETSSGFPDEFLRYRDAIVSSALASLFSYEKEPWYSPRSAADQYALARQLTNEAADQAAHAFGKARVASRPNWC